MDADRHPRSDAKLKRLAPERQAQLWTWLNEPDVTMDDLVAKIQAELQVQTSATAVHEFRSWYFLKLRNERRENRTQQILDDLKRADPKLSADQLRDYGTALFMSEALTDEDAKSFVRVGKMQLEGMKFAAGVEGFKAKYEQQEREHGLAREKFEFGKLEMRKELDALAKNLGSHDAPARVQRLVEQLEGL